MSTWLCSLNFKGNRPILSHPIYKHASLAGSVVGGYSFIPPLSLSRQTSYYPFLLPLPTYPYPKMRAGIIFLNFVASAAAAAIELSTEPGLGWEGVLVPGEAPVVVWGHSFEVSPD